MNLRKTITRENKNRYLFRTKRRRIVQNTRFVRFRRGPFVTVKQYSFVSNPLFYVLIYSSKIIPTHDLMSISESILKPASKNIQYAYLQLQYLKIESSNRPHSGTRGRSRPTKKRLWCGCNESHNLIHWYFFEFRSFVRKLQVEQGRTFSREQKHNLRMGPKHSVFAIQVEPMGKSISNKQR